MEKDWTAYQSKSGQTLFVYNKLTGEHKWPHGTGQGVEYRIMHGCPVDYREYRTAATQTDDNGCNNGCMSMYINRHLSYTLTTSTSDISPVQQGVTSKEQNLINKTSPVNTIKSEQHLQSDVSDESHMDVITDPSHVVNTSSQQQQQPETSLYNNTDQSHVTDALDTTPCEQQPSSANEENHLKTQPDCYDDVVQFYDYFDHNEDVSNNVATDTASLPQQQTDVSKEESNLNVKTLVKTAIKIEPRDEVEDQSQSSGIVTANHNNLVENGSGTDNLRDTNDQVHNQRPESISEILKGLPEIRPCYVNSSNVVVRVSDHPLFREKRFGCSYCEKTFSQKSSLSKHAIIHTELMPFQCLYCQRKFRFKSNLRIHEKSHSNERPYECSHCKKKFKTTSALNKHVRTHGAIAFECSICKKTFGQKSHLNTHIKSHTKELRKPFECHICKTSFSCNNFLVSHLKIH